MDLEYKYDTYEDFNALKAAKPKLADILIDEFYDGDWQGEDIYIYPDVKNYAMSELMDGVYQVLTHTAYQHLKNSTVPNFLEYINFNKLGQDLVESYGEKYVFVTKVVLWFKHMLGFGKL